MWSRHEVSDTSREPAIQHWQLLETLALSSDGHSMPGDLD